MRKPFALFTLLLTGFTLFAQERLTPQKVTIYHDASQVTQKGILRFGEKKARFSPGYQMIPSTVQATESGEYKLLYLKYVEDTISVTSNVSDWMDVLDANKGRTVTVVYEIANEFDEVSGEVEMVDRTGGLIVLHKSGSGDFFLPKDQVRQVIVEGAGKSTLEKQVTRTLIEVGVDKEMPFAPIELTGVMRGVRWTPVCRVKLDGERLAEYKLTALIENDSSLLQEVEVELAAAEITGRAATGSQADRYKLGKLTLRPGEKLYLDLNVTKHEYTQQFECNLPFKGLGPTQRSEPIAMSNVLRLNSPLQPAINCNTLSILNNSGHQVGSVEVEPSAVGGTQELRLGDDPRVRVTWQETQTGTPKRVKVGSAQFDQVRISGKIVVVNMKPDLVSIRVSREITGEQKGGEAATVTEGTQAGQKVLTWPGNLKSGASRTIEYQYDAMIPVQ
jgi:hypothetical protein